jgi:hypothetical protein
MKLLHAFLLVLLVGLVFSACQQESEAILDEVVPEEYTSLETSYDVPVIPEEIDRMMTEEQRTRFLAGPGEEFLVRAEAESMSDPSAKKKWAKWHPVLLCLGYDLQFVPIGGDCEGAFYPCFGPGFLNGFNPLCFPNGPMHPPAYVSGAAGQTIADGNWFAKPIHAEYFPVFCGPDYEGYGQGFYLVDGDELKLEATNTPHTTLSNGDSYFFRHGNYVGNPNGGIFANAFGWELSYMFTNAQNNPNANPNGVGFSNVITVGWVYY